MALENKADLRLAVLRIQAQLLGECGEDEIVRRLGFVRGLTNQDVKSVRAQLNLMSANLMIDSLGL